MAAAAASVVTTKSGAVRGAIANGIHAFKGIPFAAPLDGPNLFQPAQPVAWEGVREALAFGPKPPQSDYPPMVRPLIPPELSGPGADCLTLNIWTPELGAANLPVMLWIAGGMFEYHATGASPWYDGSAFARDGVVLVSINYRVGAPGFLYLDDGVANLGLLDQIAALTWVRDNIAVFGGDPGNVTVFGESAGALSVGTLLAMPAARNLFHRATVESGGAQIVTTAATAERIGRRLAKLLEVEPTRAAIAAQPVERIVAAQNALRGELSTARDPQFWGEVLLHGLPWAPVIDGEVIPAPPLDLVRAGASAGIDLLVGSNTEEWRLFLVPGGAIDQIPQAALAGMVAATGLPVEKGLAAYGELHPGASPGDLFAAVMTDWYWHIPARRLADTHVGAAAGGTTYMYEFAWCSPQFDGRLGAGHAVEIPFVFDTLGPHAEPLLGTAPPQPLADAMHAAWVNFARTGEPGWPAYDRERRTTMHFDLSSHLVDDPLAKERVLWEGVR
ncbi:carboxylesterase family protein [Devosia sp.]|uniref:carboxylesterase/lipase family protein n=1 Tax=Devosia sp. TaxID=1871048 RepID=UPI001ACCCCC1|nr:carboxylesterase family protein [Devosia sp.]MBN9311316.1 carboxylesterase/lipase family protein [Devosia sp.]